jgi:flavin-dependent thymidylate synthase
MHLNKPSVKLVHSFTQPARNIVSTAKTCYSSSGIILDESTEFPKAENLILDLLRAGHHTTFEHQYFQFAIKNISRYSVWSLLHSHPFYSSDQVSQRYTKVRPNYTFVPVLPEKALAIYNETLELQYEFYEELYKLLNPEVQKIYFADFKQKAKNNEKISRTIDKQSREIARYVLPIGTLTYLYHTINTVTLLRYYKKVSSFSISEEERKIINLMIDEVKEIEPKLKIVIDELNKSTENNCGDINISKKYCNDFDLDLGNYTSKLIDYGNNAETMLADSVRMYYGLDKQQMNDISAIDKILNPAQNKTLSSDIVLTNNFLLSKSLNHVRYTFKKKLSHIADCQNQRHRTIQSSSYELINTDFSEPDFIIPKLIKVNPTIEKRYVEMMNIIWSKINKLINLGVGKKELVYLLPNALTIRLIESGNLLNYHHKYALRLCWNAQEEIWQNSVDEIKQILQVHPNIGKFLLTPCSIRFLANGHVSCPEGKRSCGNSTWEKNIYEYDSIL